MQYFVYLVRKEGEPMTPPSPEGMKQMGELMQEAMRSGMVVATGQLADSTSKITVAGNKVTVTDGPFMEGKELIPGFTIIQVGSEKEAIEWGTKLRKCMGDGILRVSRILMPGMESE